MVTFGNNGFLGVTEDRNYKNINGNAYNTAPNPDFYLSPAHGQWTKLESVSLRFVELVKHGVGDHCSKQK